MIIVQLVLGFLLSVATNCLGSENSQALERSHITNQDVKEIIQGPGPGKLLDIPLVGVVAGGDYISLYRGKKETKLYHPDNVEIIRRALSLNNHFILRPSIDWEGITNLKVASYENGSYLWWHGWSPSFKEDCVGMPKMLSNIAEPAIINIDFGKEKESIHYYQTKRWIGRGLVAAMVLLIGYQLRNKIYNGVAILLQ